MSALTAPTVYRNTDTGAPTIGNNIGDLTTALDAILVAGYPTQTITSLTHSAGVITGTLTAHGYSVDDIITISGASPDEYNGRVQIATVADADHFTYAPVGSNPGSSPATGTIKGSTHSGKAGLGWQLAFTGTNLRSYRPRFGTRMYLGVDDSALAYNCRARGFETMSAAGVAVASGTGPYPTDTQISGGAVWQKTKNTAGNRNWIFIGDAKQMSGLIDISVNNFAYGNGFFFGDYTSFKSGDAYNSLIIGKNTSGASSTVDNLLATAISMAAVTGHYSPRSYSQSGSSVQMGKSTDYSRHNTGESGGLGTVGTTTQTYPGPIDGGLHLARFFINEPTQGVRGYLRGLWNLCHNLINMTGVANGDTFSGSDGLSGRTFELRADGNENNAQRFGIAFETSDTWDS